MRQIRLSTLGISLLFLTGVLHAQEEIADILTDPTLRMSRSADRAKMVRRIRAIENQQQAATQQKARRMGLPMRSQGADGNIVELVGFFGDEPHYITTLNANAAISTGANLLHTTPYGLDGAGVIVGVWDAGVGNPNHVEFTLPGGGTRLRQMDSTFVAAHASHVAGTIAAAGVDPAARGMAPATQIDAYSRSGDLSEMTSRAATAPDQQVTHIYLSNHSYGPFTGWSGNVWFGDGKDANAAEYRFGRYEVGAQSIDALAYNAPYYLIFWSAGNERDDNPTPGMIVNLWPTGGDGSELPAYDPLLHPPGDGVYRNGYETIAGDATAKNIVTVGALSDAVSDGFRDPAMASLTSYSSTGPTDDGRIKPDLVANGESVYSTYPGDTEYGVLSGTSMSSPNACGSAALLIQLYSRLFSGGAMRASTLKGLLIHTADDLGTPGPDYFHGWGLVNVRQAADHLVYHDTFPTRSRVTEDTLTSTQPVKSHSFVWDGVSPLRATLSWTDPAGAASGDDVHDSRTPTLVNDLNLKLIAPDGSEYLPYVMPFVGTWTTESMALPATTGVNHTDNVEQIRLDGSAQSGSWRAEVSYLGNLANGLQHYSLLISENADSLNIDTTPPNPDPLTWERSPAAGAGPILKPIAGTDFTGRTVSGAIASNIPWTLNGVNSPGNLKTTGNFTLFNTDNAQGHFVPNRNLINNGPWTIELPLVLNGDAFLLTDVALDYQLFNNNGAYQTAERKVNWTVSLTGSSSGLMRSVLVEGFPSISGIATAVFDPPLSLSNSESHVLSITATGADFATHVGLDELSINGQFGIAGDPETEISMTAATAFDLAGVEYYFTETSGNVGGDDSGWQDSPTYLDTGLIPGTTYSYTVTTRDKSPIQNTSTPSAPASAITQGVQPAFYAWSGGQAFESDANNDGVANGMAWFLGADDPQANATTLLPTVDHISDPDYLIFTYRSNNAAVAAGAQASVHYGGNLTDWLPAVHDGGDVIVNETGGTVEVRIRRTLAQDGRLFTRLEVRMPPP